MKICCLSLCHFSGLHEYNRRRALIGRALIEGDGNLHIDHKGQHVRLLGQRSCATRTIARLSPDIRVEAPVERTAERKKASATSVSEPVLNSPPRLVERS